MSHIDLMCRGHGNSEFRPAKPPKANADSYDGSPCDTLLLEVCGEVSGPARPCLVCKTPLRANRYITCASESAPIKPILSDGGVWWRHLPNVRRALRPPRPARGVRRRGWTRVLLSSRLVPLCFTCDSPWMTAESGRTPTPPSARPSQLSRARPGKAAVPAPARARRHAERPHGLHTRAVLSFCTVICCHS